MCSKITRTSVIRTGQPVISQISWHCLAFSYYSVSTETRSSPTGHVAGKSKPWGTPRAAPFEARTRQSGKINLLPWCPSFRFWWQEGPKCRCKKRSAEMDRMPTLPHLMFLLCLQCVFGETRKVHSSLKVNHLRFVRARGQNRNRHCLLILSNLTMPRSCLIGKEYIRGVRAQ